MKVEIMNNNDTPNALSGKTNFIMGILKKLLHSSGTSKEAE